MNDKIEITLKQLILIVLSFCLCMYVVIFSTLWFAYGKAEKGFYIENLLSKDIDAFHKGFNKAGKK